MHADRCASFGWFPASLLLACALGCAGGDAAGDLPPDDASALPDGSRVDSGSNETPDSAASDAIDATDAAGGDAIDARDGDAKIDASVVDPLKESLVGVDVPSQRVGMFYLVWHAPAATAQREVAAKGGTPLTIEDVLRSGGASKLGDVVDKWGVAGDAMGFYWNARPKLGFYCLYRARAGETGWVPDCPDIEATAARHAEQLVAAGVDFIVIDATNLTGLDRASDLLQLRPTEVLFEEWKKLRAAGKKTPQIAVWNAIDAGALQWRKFLDLYDDPSLDGLVMHDKKTGKKVFFVVDSSRAPDPTTLAAITSDGGKNDIVVQRMWTLDRTDAAIDRWAFMSYCDDGGRVTTSIVGNPSCNQPYTKSSALGSAVAVAPSFQTGYGSLPFGSAGKLSGLTFKRQWATALSVRPDYVFISGWNELISQPQPNPFASDPYAFSMGLEQDPDGRRLFVDTFGAELSRDIEPTEESGSLYYDLTTSCVRVFRSGATSCSAASEPCCDVAASDVYRNVYALDNDGAHDDLLTTSEAERDALRAPGKGWRDVCSRYGTPTSFCTRSDDPSTPFGPFIAFAADAAGRKALYRCLVGSAHFYSLDPTCEGRTVESALVYLAQTKSSEMPRRAERCLRASTGAHFVALGAACPAGSTDEGTLGYVR